MAYVDHAFSISDEDIMMDSDSSYTVHNRPPAKEIGLAVALLVFGVLGIVSGVFMSINRVGGDTGHGIFFVVLGAVLFIPGFYYTRIAYYAYKGYKDLWNLFGYFNNTEKDRLSCGISQIMARSHPSDYTESAPGSQRKEELRSR